MTLDMVEINLKNAWQALVEMIGDAMAEDMPGAKRHCAAVCMGCKTVFVDFHG